MSRSPCPPSQFPLNYVTFPATGLGCGELCWQETFRDHRDATPCGRGRD